MPIERAIGMTMEFPIKQIGIQISRTMGAKEIDDYLGIKLVKDIVTALTSIMVQEEVVVEEGVMVFTTVELIVAVPWTIRTLPGFQTAHQLDNTMKGVEPLQRVKHGLEGQAALLL